MKDELPQGWAETTLSEVVESMKNGLYKPADAYADDGIACLRMYNIENGSIVWQDIKRMRLSANEVQEYQLLPGDLLVNRVNSRELVGKTALIPRDLEQCVFESKNIRLRLRRQVICPALANYALILGGQRHFKQNAQQVVGMASISQPQIGAFPLRLPPIAEQRRLVAKLEEILAKVDACQKRLEKFPVLLKRFRQSVLAAACSGRLTSDWREENPDAEPYPVKPRQPYYCEETAELPEGWRLTCLGTLTNLITSGSRGWAKYYADGGSIFVRAQNINSDALNLDDIAFVSLPSLGAEGLRTKVQQHDILVTITGANVTKSALVDRPLEDAYVNQHVALVRLADVRLSKFLFYSIVSVAHGRKQLQAAAYGQGKPGLNLDNIRDVVVSLPPLLEQQEIVRRVKVLFGLADRLETRYQKAQKRVDSLMPSILAKAFSGELVPTEAELALREGRDYEPASALLERIQRGKSSSVSRAKAKNRVNRSTRAATGAHV
jgi:type I restriction enzyme S subunit